MGPDKALSTTASSRREGTRRVVARVRFYAPDFELVFVRTSDDFQYALTPLTRGVRLEFLREGQTLDCVISGGLPRVLSATVVEQP
jgi:hypothetical protein